MESVERVKKLNHIRIVAVSKKQSIERIKWAISQGFTAFGENYLQEALPKIDFFKQSPQEKIQPEWHFIGRIQSNKTQLIASHFDWVQSVDRLKIAQRLHDHRDPSLSPLNICIQLNLSHQPHQAGIDHENLLDLVHGISSLSRLRLRGLMTIVTKDYEKVAQEFYTLQQQGINIDTLSMGMSQDYQHAIALGANMIRLGTMIFGERR